MPAPQDRSVRIRVRGQVQGVGFRPFVWQLAQRFHLSGHVLNDAKGVLIHLRGAQIDRFVDALHAESPALARIDQLDITDIDLAFGPGFAILQSGQAGAETRVTPDAATCNDCVAEIFDPKERRSNYAFTNCTNCGPRLSILHRLPYDRAQTSMVDFVMCDACRTEYESPADRRFHAQPIACPDCGPRLWFERCGDAPGTMPDTQTAIEQAATALLAGEIVAIKGLGGIHLAVDAGNADAIARLRLRKNRPTKPLALMAPLDHIQTHARPSPQDIALLTDPAAPIVLLTKQGDTLPAALAPLQDQLGWMLPYTPLHHLLLAACDTVLVMTSANLSGEPQVIGNDEAREKLGQVADGLLLHDRDIARRLDDGVERTTPQGRMVLRRARGRVPGTFALPPGLPDQPVVAYGGEMKSAICLVKNNQALLSHHMGDLDGPANLAEFHRADQDYAELFDHSPVAVAVDCHPDFQATRHGTARARALNLPLIEVQHHHAHMAAALGESGWHGDQAVGIILDGLGLGADGTIWGGEILVGHYAQVRRAAWLSPAPLIGGDRAQSEPWRNALVRLDAAGLSDRADALFPQAPREMARQVTRAGLAPVSSSVGRLFDAVAACLDLCAPSQSYEGEAAMQLETLAARARDTVLTGYAFDMITAGPGIQIDPNPMFRALMADLSDKADPSLIAARFHIGLADAYATCAAQIATQTATNTIALSGGCFQNALLLDLMCHRLAGFELCLPKDAPANDGGLAYGQALVALARLGAP